MRSQFGIFLSSGVQNMLRVKHEQAANKRGGKTRKIENSRRPEVKLRRLNSAFVRNM